MKTRNGYVSNSSSSSFLVPFKVEGQVSSVKLPKEIWKAIEKNHVDWDGKKFDMSKSNEWWLTEMVSDCQEQYSELSNDESIIQYLEGNDMPYGCYDEDGEKAFIKFKKNGQNFYVLASDFLDENGKSDVPESVQLREWVTKILESKNLSKSQKLDAVKFIFDF